LGGPSIKGERLRHSEYVVLFSGGIGSWAAARRLRDDNPLIPISLLFTDTGIEDDDLHRFLTEAAADLDSPLHRIADGRTPWELFNDENMIGNTRADLCSRVLKRDLARKWINERWPDGTTVVMGIDWSEAHRFERAAPRWLPHTLIAPLTEPPYLSKLDMITWVRSRDIEPPRLYGMGFPHNNCGGFCVKQGQGAFIKLLEQMPDRYDEHENAESEFRARTGKDVAILRDRREGTTKPFTLRQLRQRYEDQPEQLDLLDIGGCGCMVD